MGYFVRHEFLAVIKVPAHQLEHNFTRKTNAPALEPNVTFAYMNQHADNAATHAMNNLANQRLSPALVKDAQFTLPTKPVTSLPGLRYPITIGGALRVTAKLPNQSMKHLSVSTINEPVFQLNRARA